MIKKYYAADFTVGGRVELDATGGIKSMKELKQSIRDAQLDLINMQEKFGATSTEAINAAKRVAELKDTIGDANELVNAFNPDEKFRALGSALNGVLGGFTALTGAMSLLGIESEDVQKQLLKVQSALALSQGLNQIGGAVNSFKALGQTIVQTLGKGGLIGVAIAGVAALSAALFDVFNTSKKVTAQQQALNDVTDEAAKIFAKERLALENNKRALESENTSRAQKEKIIKTLQDQYPGYFKNLDLEGNKVVGLTEDYNILIKVIGLKARATAAANLLAKQEEELLQQGFAMGITSEEDAMNLLKRLEASDDVVSQLAAQKGREILARRKFLQDIQAAADEEIKNLQGNRNTAPSTTTSATTSPTKVKSESEKQLEAEIDGRTKLERWRDEVKEEEKQKQAEEEEESFKRAYRIQEGIINLKQDGAKKEIQVAAHVAAEVKKIGADQAQAQIDADKKAAEAKILTMRFVANQSAIFADLAGRETAAGKVLAIASATINTYLAATEALKANYTAYGPAAQFVRIATVVSTIALGLKQVREIVKTQVPGRSGGGSVPSAPSLSSATAPLSPQAQSTNTFLNQNQLNQIGNAAVRAFVVESDVTTNQERIRMLNRRARL